MQNSKKILVVDDTETNIEILLELLGETYDVFVALEGQTALDIAQEVVPDLILLDIMMPFMDGYEVCEKLKENDLTKDIHILFITAKTDEDSIEKAYDVGGSDYVTKPFKPKELLARVNRELQLQELQSELKLLASTDPLTKLYNRRHFCKVSDHILDLAKRDKKELSVLMLDIDKFKSINDTYGHKVGDDVIIKLADKLKECQRKSDIICRYGGEEFLVLLPETSLEGAVTAAKNIREEIEKVSIGLDLGTNLRFTVSIGVSNVYIEKEDSLESAIKRADEALYEAKKSGRNRVCFKY